MSGKTPQTIGPAIIKDIAKNIKQSASPLQKTSFPITVLPVAKNGFFCCQERNILLLNTGQTVAKHGISCCQAWDIPPISSDLSFSKCGSLYLKVRKFSTGNPQVSDRRNRRTRFISALMQQRATRHQQQNLHTATISVPQTPYRKIWTSTARLPHNGHKHPINTTKDIWAAIRKPARKERRRRDSEREKTRGSTKKPGAVYTLG